MVKLFGLVIVKTKNLPSESKSQILTGYIDSPWYVMAYKDQLKKFTIFFSKLIAEKVKPGEHRQVRQEDKFCYVISRKNGITGILLADLDYKPRIAFSIVESTLDKFENSNKKIIEEPKKIKDFGVTSFNQVCKDILIKHQDPTEVDDIEKAMKKINEIKLIMNSNLEKMLDRGESLQKLMEQAEDLDDNAYDFYVTARKSRCGGCNIL